MDSTLTDNLQPPRFETGKALLVAGLGERYTWESGGPAIPGQWQRFHQTVENIPRRIGKVAYGVCCNGDDSGNFDYIAGVEVSDFSDLPREFSRVRIPEQKYAVFTHSDHVSTIRRTINTIWNQWLPASGMKAADAPNFERYGENFDPLTGNGGLEIWLPVGIRCERFRTARGAALRGRGSRHCLASDIDFAITWRNESVARAE